MSWMKGRAEATPVARELISRSEECIPGTIGSGLCYFSPRSPSELCGHGRREEPLLPVGGPVRPEQPAGPPVQSHPLEEDGEEFLKSTETVAVVDLAAMRFEKRRISELNGL